LQKYLDGKNSAGLRAWEKEIGNFLLGRVSEQSLVTAAQLTDREPSAAQLCEAYFYAGARRIVQSDRIGARECFGKSAATDAPTTAERISAAAELAFMGPEGSR
jgi:lipoprotein NlpI